MTAEIVKGQQIRNVAVYCRVSTNISDQADSLENQIMYFENYVNNHPFWKLYKIYVDEGITLSLIHIFSKFFRYLQTCDMYSPFGGLSPPYSFSL